MKKRVLFIDILRIFAIFGVIMIHVTAEGFNTNIIDSFVLKNNFMNSLVHSYSVPIFIVISGYLLLDNDKFTYKSMILKYLPRIIICLSFWHFIYYFFQFGDFSLNNIVNSFKNLIIGKTYSHLWYLYLIIGLYLLTPILKKLIVNLDKKDFNYLLILGFSVSSLVPSISNIVNIEISKIIIPYKVLDFNVFILYYLLGNYLKKYNIKYCKIGIIISAILIIAIAIFNNYVSLNTNILTNYLDNTSIFGVLFTANLFSYLKKICENKENIFISRLGKLTFGVYLIHFLIEKVLLRIGTYTNYINPLFGSILTSLIILVLSYLFCFILSRIPYFKKIIL